MSEPALDLRRLTALQRELEARTRTLGTDAKDVLETGRAVLTFAEREEAAVFPLLPLLDPAARAELADEHQLLASDLQLLQWLRDTTPESPDVEALAEALARRMRNHIARDGRLLAQAMRLAGR
jgi:hypothetical protein